MTSKKRIRIESNGHCDQGGDTRVFIDGEDISASVSHVTWAIGVHRDESLARATVTFTGVELAVEYVAEETDAQREPSA